MCLVELRFRGIRARICLGLGADEFARLAEQQVVGAAVGVLVHAAMGTLRRLATWFENLEHAVVLYVLQLLLYIHFRTHRLLIGADAGSLVGNHLQVRACCQLAKC